MGQRNRLEPWLCLHWPQVFLDQGELGELHPQMVLEPGSPTAGALVDHSIDSILARAGRTISLPRQHPGQGSEMRQEAILPEGHDGPRIHVQPHND